jgi:Mrp family chromosome partitioning ATPase
VVILDSAPILAVTDAAIVAPLCATVLMVVKQHELQRSDLENSRKRLDQVGVSVTGAVINDLPTRGQGYYYYYYYAYQGYYNRYENRYGNAYVSVPEDKELPRWKRIFNKLFM